MRNYLAAFLLLNFSCCYSQQENDSISGLSQMIEHKENNSNQIDSKLFRRNGIKVNLFSLLVNNYSVSFERIISRKMSIQIGYRYQPYKYLMENPIGRFLTKKGAAIDLRYYNFQTSNNALSSDFRVYTGKKYGAQGFYFGLYGRYASFDADNIDYNYITKNDDEYLVPLVSNFNGFGGGIVMGRQWLIKKRISIDYSFGFHYGKLNGSLVSNKDLSGLTNQEKNELQANIEELFIIVNKNYLSTITVDNSGVTGKISGPFLGIRSGLSIGIVF